VEHYPHFCFGPNKSCKTGLKHRPLRRGARRGGASERASASADRIGGKGPVPNGTVNRKSLILLGFPARGHVNGALTARPGPWPTDHGPRPTCSPRPLIFAKSLILLGSLFPVITITGNSGSPGRGPQTAQGGAGAPGAWEGALTEAPSQVFPRGRFWRSGRAAQTSWARRLSRGAGKDSALYKTDANCHFVTKIVTL
jgi:hypothetical protein